MSWNNNRFLTCADWRVARSFARNLVVAIAFVGCALGSQWVWGLILDPTSLIGQMLTLFCQIAFGVGAMGHVVCGVVVLLGHAIRDMMNQFKDERNGS